MRNNRLKGSVVVALLSFCVIMLGMSRCGGGPKPGHVDDEAKIAKRTVASFPAADAFGLRVEQEVPIAVDVANVHLFDRESGEPLR